MERTERRTRIGPAGLPLALAALGTLLAAAVGAQSEAPSAREILERVEQAEQFNVCYMEMTQTITTSSGERRTLSLRTWAENSGENQLTEYLSPADVRGQKILTTDHGDNIWLYNPETRRTRRLGSHMRNRKVMGSDFTYEDQASYRVSEDYTGVVLREESEDGVACWVLELTPTDSGPSYDKVLAWIGKEDDLPRRMDYYDDGEDEPFKRLVIRDYRETAGHHTPHSMTMTNLEDDTSTVVAVQRVNYGDALPEGTFESRNLGR